jgi:hypothetical protein
MSEDQVDFHARAQITAQLRNIVAAATVAKLNYGAVVELVARETKSLRGRH